MLLYDPHSSNSFTPQSITRGYSEIWPRASYPLSATLYDLLSVQYIQLSQVTFKDKSTLVQLNSITDSHNNQSLAKILQLKIILLCELILCVHKTSEPI